MVPQALMVMVVTVVQRGLVATAAMVVMVRMAQLDRLVLPAPL